MNIDEYFDAFVSGVIMIVAIDVSKSAVLELSAQNNKPFMFHSPFQSMILNANTNEYNKHIKF
jgi:hypothetical protein